MKPWRWVGLDVINAIHDRQLAEHGGLAGIRDQAAVQSAWAAPKHLANYADPDAAALAAAYAYAITNNHGFSDGNKRTAWVVARLFLLDNGYAIHFDPGEAVKMMEAIAAGTLPQDDVAYWFRGRMKKRRSLPRASGKSVSRKPKRDRK